MINVRSPSGVKEKVVRLNDTTTRGIGHGERNGMRWLISEYCSAIDDGSCDKNLSFG